MVSPRTSNSVPVVEFPPGSKYQKRYDFEIEYKPQEDIWPYIETGRREKTFELVNILGEGGAGAVFKEKHKLDGKIYAVKVIRINVPYSTPTSGKHEMGDYVLSHPAMKEIGAISKLSHKNIVGYKGCWVEAEEPCQERLNKVLKKLQRRDNPRGGKALDSLIIDENEEQQDPDHEFKIK